jgi:hypothetical protein
LFIHISVAGSTLSSIGSGITILSFLSSSSFCPQEYTAIWRCSLTPTINLLLLVLHHCYYYESIYHSDRITIKLDKVSMAAATDAVAKTEKKEQSQKQLGLSG